MLFVNPAAEKFGGFLSRYVPVGIPVGIGFLAAYMEKHGIACHVIDEEIEAATSERIRQVLADMPSPHIVGIGCLTAHVARAYEIARTIKRDMPDVIVVVGGLHPTALPDEPLDTDAVDFVIRGEGEEVLYQLYQAIHQGSDPTALRGISYRREGKNHHNPDAPLIPDLDTIPAFPYHLFKNSKYDMGFLTTSRGCPYRCSFCSQRMMTGTTYRYKSVEKVVDELEILVNDFGQESVVFYDDNFCVKKRRVLDLCDEIIKRNLQKKVRLSVQTRADNLVNQGGDEVVARMAEAGFTHCGLGLETGVQRLADLTMKDETIEIHMEAVKLCRRHGLDVSLAMIYGLPTETRQDRETGFKVVQSQNVHSTKFNNLIPYPGTPLYQDLMASGRVVIEKHWSNFNSTLAITRSIFDKTPLPYVPETCSEWELKREIILYNLRSYLTFKVIMSILDHTKGMGWVALPKRWYLSPGEVFELTKVGLKVMTNFAWSILPLWFTEPIMGFLNPALKKRRRIPGYDPASFHASDWDKNIVKNKMAMLKEAREEYKTKGSFSLDVNSPAE